MCSIIVAVRRLQSDVYRPAFRWQWNLLLGQACRPAWLHPLLGSCSWLRRLWIGPSAGTAATRPEDGNGPATRGMLIICVVAAQRGRHQPVLGQGPVERKKGLPMGDLAEVAMYDGSVFQ